MISLNVFAVPNVTTNHGNSHSNHKCRRQRRRRRRWRGRRWSTLGDIPRMTWWYSAPVQHRNKTLMNFYVALIALVEMVFGFPSSSFEQTNQNVVWSTIIKQCMPIIKHLHKVWHLKLTPSAWSTGWHINLVENHKFRHEWQFHYGERKTKRTVYWLYSTE